MHDMVRYLVLATALCVLPACAAAEPVNLRIYSTLDEDATLTVDSDHKIHVHHRSVNFGTVLPGEHHFELTTVSGKSYIFDATLDSAAMASARGRSWWCIRPDNDLHEFYVDTRENCQRLIDTAPADDVPEGH
jgi:hypothetical protein